MAEALPPEPPSPPPPPPPAGWEDILEPGETILWQGQPERPSPLMLLHRRGTIMALIMTLFVLFWLAIALAIAQEAPFFIRLFLLGAGGYALWQSLSLSLLPELRHWLRLRGSYYTLTDRTAFIATEILGRKALERYPLHGPFSPRLEEGLPGSVWLTRRQPETGALMRGDFFGYFISLTRLGEEIGFENIEGARRVYQLICEQRAAHPAGRARAPEEGGPS